jgi:transporter family protein
MSRERTTRLFSTIQGTSPSGVTTSLSWIFYYKALKDGEVSTIALIDKGSMVVAVIHAYFILKEQITWKTLAGGSLMIAGILIIARK